VGKAHPKSARFKTQVWGPDSLALIPASDLLPVVITGGFVKEQLPSNPKKDARRARKQAAKAGKAPTIPPTKDEILEHNYLKVTQPAKDLTRTQTRRAQRVRHQLDNQPLRKRAGHDMRKHFYHKKDVEVVTFFRQIPSSVALERQRQIKFLKYDSERTKPKSYADAVARPLEIRNYFPLAPDAPIVQNEARPFRPTRYVDQYVYQMHKEIGIDDGFDYVYDPTQDPNFLMGIETNPGETLVMCWKNPDSEDYLIWPHDFEFETDEEYDDIFWITVPFVITTMTHVNTEDMMMPFLPSLARVLQVETVESMDMEPTQPPHPLNQSPEAIYAWHDWITSQPYTNHDRSCDSDFLIDVESNPGPSFRVYYRYVSAVNRLELFPFEQRDRWDPGHEYACNIRICHKIYQFMVLQYDPNLTLDQMICRHMSVSGKCSACHPAAAISMTHVEELTLPTGWYKAEHPMRGPRNIVPRMQPTKEEQSVDPETYKLRYPERWLIDPPKKLHFDDFIMSWTSAYDEQWSELPPCHTRNDTSEEDETTSSDESTLEENTNHTKPTTPSPTPAPAIPPGKVQCYNCAKIFHKKNLCKHLKLCKPKQTEYDAKGKGKEKIKQSLSDTNAKEKGNNDAKKEMAKEKEEPKFDRTGKLIQTEPVAVQTTSNIYICPVKRVDAAKLIWNNYWKKAENKFEDALATTCQYISQVSTAIESSVTLASEAAQFHSEQMSDYHAMPGDLDVEDKVIEHAIRTFSINAVEWAEAYISPALMEPSVCVAIEENSKGHPIKEVCGLLTSASVSVVNRAVLSGLCEVSRASYVLTEAPKMIVWPDAKIHQECITRAFHHIRPAKIWDTWRLAEGCVGAAMEGIVVKVQEAEDNRPLAVRSQETFHATRLLTVQPHVHFYGAPSWMIKERPFTDSARVYRGFCPAFEIQEETINAHWVLRPLHIHENIFQEMNSANFAYSEEVGKHLRVQIMSSLRASRGMDNGFFEQANHGYTIPRDQMQLLCMMQGRSPIPEGLTDGASYLK